MPGSHEHGDCGSIPAWAGEPHRICHSSKDVWVYPRVGGGTASRVATATFDLGLSPRGRGNHHHQVAALADSRSIPAWAGEPSSRPILPNVGKVYPRVGGGTFTMNAGAQARMGLSPRGRGNHSRCYPNRWLRGSIPAWAGEPRPGPAFDDRDRVYPRVGGGTLPSCSHAHPRMGLSPRGRGNHGHETHPIASMRSIPAWAGEPSSWRLLKASQRVYPRVGGGTVTDGICFPPMQGLSPRGRGNLGVEIHEPYCERSIPAWAGEPVVDNPAGLALGVYPRVGGGTGDRFLETCAGWGLSPRGRGNHL